MAPHVRWCRLWHLVYSGKSWYSPPLQLVRTVPCRRVWGGVVSVGNSREVPIPLKWFVTCEGGKAVVSRPHKPFDIAIPLGVILGGKHLLDAKVLTKSINKLATKVLGVVGQ